jgi:hypothetical protein
MKNRILTLGGHFEIISEPLKGVLTRAIFPLNTTGNGGVEGVSNFFKLN